MKKKKVNEIISINDIKNDRKNVDIENEERANKLEYYSDRIFSAYENYMKKVEKATTLEEKKKICRHFSKVFNEFFEFVYGLVMTRDEVSPAFKDGIDYAVLNGGKRLRPILMLLTYFAFYGDDIYNISDYLVSMEIIHSASLIHDDMPCMDNDELRRGKPSVWKTFGEDKALLIGDAMFTFSFHILTKALEDIILLYHLEKDLLEQEHKEKHSKECDCCDEHIFENYLDFFTANTVSINYMHSAAGLTGMMLGQMDEIVLQNKNKISEKDILNVYNGKTSALFKACFLVGKELAMDNNDVDNEFIKLGGNLGIAFQIKDDIYDITKTTKELGKPANSDLKNDKKTFVLGKDEKTLKQQYKKYVDNVNEILDKVEKKANIQVIGLKTFIEVMLEL